MKFGIIVFPGSNCDKDMLHALHNDMHQEVVMLWHKDNDLNMFTNDDCIILPGGFSYGDYLRCGVLARFSNIMEQVIKFAERGGEVLGICNGFQILCEAGLLPGILLRNENQRFVCRNVHIKSETLQNRVGRSAGAQVLKIPVAHGDGRYYAPPETLKRLHDNNQVLFRYCNEQGEVHTDSNPNGAINNIAGICNDTHNVFGMMPHPERACSEALRNTDGRLILKAFMNTN
jgi:phosphoribosylformylglycinamidine synthase